jgi:hypothetical protein
MTTKVPGQGMTRIRRADETKLTLTLEAQLRRKLDARVAKSQETISSFMQALIADFLRQYKEKQPQYLATRQPYVLFQIWLKDDLSARFKAKAKADGVSLSVLLATMLRERLPG